MVTKTKLQEKSYEFSIRVVNLVKFLHSNNEFVLSKQLLRSGTSIAALVYEAEFAQSIADMISKFSIALKEANETKYWLNLLKDTDYLTDKMFISIEKDILEVIKILVTSIKSLKDKS